MRVGGGDRDSEFGEFALFMGGHCPRAYALAIRRIKGENSPPPALERDLIVLLGPVNRSPMRSSARGISRRAGWSGAPETADDLSVKRTGHEACRQGSCQNRLVILRTDIRRRDGRALSGQHSPSGADRNRRRSGGYRRLHRSPSARPGPKGDCNRTC